MLGKLFRLLIQANLKLKGSKCTFGATRVTFLGHEISRHGIRQEQNKLRSILKLEPPKDAKATRRILGLLSYYRKFVPKFAILAEPLTKLTKKKAKFEWKEEQEDAFRSLIKELANNATLAHYDHSLPTMIKTDASHAGVAGILLQKHDNDWRIIACCSRRLSASEANYGITDLEGLAIIYTVTKLRHFLLGKHFEILTDHCALCVLNSRTPTSPRLRRWAIVMSEFDYKIVYTKGNLHEDIDCLSRAPVDSAEDEFLDNKVYFIVSPANIDKWVSAYDDQQSQDMLGKAKRNQCHLSVKNNLIYYKDKLYVPLSQRDTMIHENHDLPIAGHGGVQATTDKMADLWWPSLAADVKNYIEKCETCQARKFERAKPAGSMSSFEVFAPLTLVAIDCMGPITSTLRGSKHVIIAIDMFTRFVDARAVSDIKAATFTEFLLDYCGRYGVPQEILTDNSSTFCNVMVKEVNKILGVRHMKSTPHHSRGNAIVERVIQTLQEKLGLITNSPTNPGEWDVALPLALLSMNTSVHKATGYSPYELTFGTRPPVSNSLVPKTTAHDLYSKVIKAKLEELHIDTIANNSKAQDSSRTYFDIAHRPREFAVGDRVWIKVAGRRAKLDNRFHGPFEVMSRSKDIYKVKDKENDKTFNRHVKDLKPYKTGGQANVQIGVNLISFTCIALLAMVTMTAANPFDQADPIIYSQSTYYVDSGPTNFAIEIQFDEPCALFDKGNHTRVEEHSVYLTRSYCNRYFFESITEPLQKLAEVVAKRSTKAQVTRKKRFILGLVTGVFITNIFHTIMDRIWSTNSISQLDNQIILTQQAQKRLEARTNVTELIEHAVAESLKVMSDEIQSQKRRIQALEMSQRHIALLGYLGRRLTIKQGMLDTLRHSMQHNRVDIDTLNDLAGTEWPENIDDKTISLIDAHANPVTGLLRVEFSARVKRTDAVILQVNSFKHWVFSNFSEQAKLVEFTGKKFIFHNTTNNCIKGIDQPTTDYVTVSCDEQYSHEHGREDWKLVKTSINPTNEIAGTASIIVHPYVYIHCFPLKITIDRKTMSCPPYVFRLAAGRAWNTTDNHRSNPTASRHIDQHLETHWKVPKVTRDEDSEFDASKAVSKTFELLEQLSKLDHEGILVKAPLVGPISKTFFIWVLIAIMVVICFIKLYAILSVLSPAPSAPMHRSFSPEDF